MTFFDLISPSLLAPAINVLLHSIINQFLSNSYCLTIVSEYPLDFQLNITFTYIIPNDNIEEFKYQLLVASDQGCSDYIVNIRDQTKFMTAFDMVNKAGTVRRSDKKVIFLPISEKSCLNKTFDLFYMKEADYVASLLIILPSTVVWGTNCETYDLYTHKFTGSEYDKTQPLFLNQWDSCTEEFKTNDNLFPHDISNMFGKLVKIGSFHYKPYVLLEDVDRSLTPTGRDGMEIRIVEEFCRWINCTIEIIRDNKYQWGEIFENGTGNGVMGSVVEDRADLGICGLYSWYEDFIHLDFCTPHIRSSVTCVAPSPKLLTTWAMPFLPYSRNMWCGVILTFLFASLGLFIAQHCNTDGIFLIVFRVLISQSQQNVEKNWRVRSVSGWLLMGSLILVSAYGGGLASTFTVPKYEAPIDTMQDLADRNMQWGATHDAWVFSLTLSTEPLVQKIIDLYHTYSENELRKKSFENEMAFGIEILPGGHYAIGEYLSHKALMDMTVMLEDFYYGEVIVVLRKSSPYTEKLSVLVGRLQQSGLILAWEDQVALQYLNLKVQQEVKHSRLKKNVGFIKPLNLANVMSIFILYVIGVIISAIIFLVEQLKRRSRF